jgi:4-phospho-D-threonate 3-dehydrogenase / 4-phospho-D-erythronate 3-dehydrogenase
MKKPLIGISMGDPSGIGPEICVKSVTDDTVIGQCRPVIVGSAEILRRAAVLLGSDWPVHIIGEDPDTGFRDGVINIYDVGGIDHEKVKFGEISVESGNAAFQAVKNVISLALDGRVDATVTAPIHKESLNLAGHKYAGHTEIYADLTGSKQVAMLLADGDFRVIHVSTHVSLRQACDRVKKDRILHVIHLLQDACRQFGVEKPRLAVCGLNPHASDGGLFGDEEDKEIIPAINQAKKEGILVDGPFAADTIISKVIGGFFDGCVAMYHDQGHIPFKVKGFVWDRETGNWGKIRGVNITLGIPIIRVSVDHGTAFDIAGKGIASCESMVHAIEYAVRMVKHKMSENKQQ